MSERTYTVTLARAAFEYVPVVDIPAWWTPGQRVTASRGETITVNQADYDRGRRYYAFADVPPLPTREVTVVHANVDYTPQPFPLWEPEWLRRIAFRGETITMLEDEYQQALDAGAFEEWRPISEYGVVGDPPLDQGVIVFVNWVRAAPPDAIDRLLRHVDELAAGKPGGRATASEVRRQLAIKDTNGHHMTTPLNLVHELLQSLAVPEPSEDLTELLEKIRDHMVTNPDVVAAVLAKQAQGN